MAGRRANDSTNVQIAAILDEAAAYATNEGLGTALAQYRKYQFSAIVAVQGLHQAEAELAEQLKTNTAVKCFFATDNPDEVDTIADMIFQYQPSAIKQDMRYRVNDRLIDAGSIQTYSSFEQKEHARSRVQALKPRDYLLKVRTSERTGLGPNDVPLVRTPDFYPRWTLEEAVAMVTQVQSYAGVMPDRIDRELQARWEWLDQQGYATVHTQRVEKK